MQWTERRLCLNFDYNYELLTNDVGMLDLMIGRYDAPVPIER